MQKTSRRSLVINPFLIFTAASCFFAIKQESTQLVWLFGLSCLCLLAFRVIAIFETKGSKSNLTDEITKLKDRVGLMSVRLGMGKIEE